MRLLVAVIAMTVLYGCTAKPEPAPEPVPNALTREMCDGAGGHWNECGSACRGAPPGTACPAVCVAYCECGGIAGFGCPKGYKCTDYLPSRDTPDDMGICKKII